MNFSEELGEPTKTSVGIQGERELFFKICQNKYFCCFNENTLFWKKCSQMGKASSNPF